MCFSLQVHRNLSELAEFFQARIDKRAFLDFEAKKSEFPNLFKGPDEDDRIYPHTFLPVVHEHQDFGRIIRPMRYRLRPHDAKEEVPSKYNLFNARLDSLQKRKSWSAIFGRNHGLIAVKKFYEWVEDENAAKELVAFRAQEELMSIPVLYDFYEGEHSFYSCAAITQEPVPEIEAAGHDRMPIFLKEEHWARWLEAKEERPEDYYPLLKDPKESLYRVESIQKKTKQSLRNRDQMDLFEGE